MKKGNNIHAKVSEKTKKLFKAKAEKYNITETKLIELIAENDFIFLDENAKKIIDFITCTNLQQEVYKEKDIKASNGRY